MKRFIVAATIVVLIALALLGNQIAGRALDAELGPLLTKQLGLPVTLTPITARLVPLQARSDKLVMGDADRPAVVATDVEVRLSWPDLLRGEIRLVYASATDLTLQLSRWPSSDSPAPTDYQFLEQWLPRNLNLETGAYFFSETENYPVQNLHWQRHVDGSASVTWSENHQTREFDFTAQLHSLEDLLHLAPIALDLALELSGEPGSQITLKTTVQPGKSSAYSIEGDLQTPDGSAHIVATGKSSWTLPDHSNIHIPLLKPEQLLELFDRYSTTEASEDATTWLAAAVPRLDLPSHRGHVVIDQIRWDDETAMDTEFDFASSEQGLQVTGLSSKWATALLKGEVGIASSDEGWTVKGNAAVTGRDGKDNLAAGFVDTDWRWQSGQTTFSGRGKTWGTLLNSLEGNLAMVGEYASSEPTPIAINAQLDNRPGVFALDQMDIKLGAGQISGSAELSGKERRTLTLDLKGDNVDLDFLFEDEEAESEVGMALPEYLTALPEVALNVTLDLTDLEVPGLSLARITAALERTEEGGKLVATGVGKHYGDLKLTLAANARPDKPRDFTLDIQFTELDLPDMFKQPGLINSRTSGTMNFESTGKNMREVFAAMQGKSALTVAIRADNDWKRASSEQETLKFTGESRLVLDKDRIVGVQLQKLDIESIEQDLTGKISLVAGRDPWFVADLESEKLDISGLQALLPQTADETAGAGGAKSAEKSDMLKTIKSMGAARVSLNADVLTLEGNVPVKDVALEITSNTKAFTLDQFDFTAERGKLQSHGSITWQKKGAKLEGVATVADFNLDQFIIRAQENNQVPVSGSAKLTSEGDSMEELLSNLTGYIELQASEQQQADTAEARRKLQMTASQLPNGMQAEITSLQWGESELSGIVRYHRTTPAMLDIEIHGGSISLLPWENAYLNAAKKSAKKAKGSAVGSAAKASAKFVGDVLLTPLKFFTGEDKGKPGERIFSTDPLPTDALKDLNLKLSGHLDALTSTELSAEDISVSATLANGQLDVQASSGKMGGGSGEVTLAANVNATPPTLKVDSHFEQVRGLANEDTYPRSGMISIETRGDSEAQLAANTSGILYLELGKGPFDYANSALLTANLASTVFSTLIPGIEKKKPEVDCGVTVGLFTAGLGSTPYGFAARTDEANLLGHVEIDLVSETLQMSLDSRGRHGIGLSVGSVFSNSIQIKGPLTDPAVVPDATSLIWRGWAAFMTGGLSVLGETLVKRVLASDNPCTSTKKIIQKDLCPKNPIAAASKMVCPNG